ncbi:MAG: multifunctional oxoglutarate decarboxylase/oxoglutarate dehydrogenase thiamine pyrophosphate-binding subunit/dihydrolipoyllysine-residue succinyltransferase subunit [Bacteroidota bacterium]
MSNFGFNSGYVDDIYAQYLEDPNSVSESWREFFADYDPSPTFIGANPDRIAATTAPPATTPPATSQPASTPSGDGATKEAAPARTQIEVPVPEGAEVTKLRGVPAKIVENMEASLSIPTATSVRSIPVKLMAENRRLINRFQRSVGGDKVSYTHLIAYAIILAMKQVPSMKATFRQNGAPERIDPPHVNFGLAIDIERRGKRQLLVPNVHAAESMSFAQFLGAYNDIVRRARGNGLELKDFQYTTATLTNPGMIGTVMSVPRLMPGQGVIVAAGAIGYPPEYSALPKTELSRLGISETMTLTSTYDHRVIQGAESGEFLNYIAQLLQGQHNFYEAVFRSLGISTPPFKPAQDSTPYLVGSRERDEIDFIKKQAAVLQLIRAYRSRGHLLATTNPIGADGQGGGYHPEIDPAEYGLTIWDLDRHFITGELGTAGGNLGGETRLPLRDILDILWETYTRNVGVEFMHISTPAEKRWLIERIEPERFQSEMPVETKRRILEKLNQAEALESFIHTKYIGQKRFSLEGGESLIPILDMLLSDAADQEAGEVVIGMAHRGRLNVLANILDKPYSAIFDGFEGTVKPDTVQGSGDVKYHLGAESTHTSPSGETVTVALAPNPSHLEAVNPVVEGMVRAKQQLIVGDRNPVEVRDRVIPILIHGDAAFAGQGVVAETLNLSQLDGYATGGTVHVVVNNQIGFTTVPVHARSSVYATDIARMIQAPIFHVNGDDPEACVRVARLALDYRQVFNKDVVIDMICYRKFGHNEGDEPKFTQPLMYQRIDGHRSVRKLYLEQLLKRGEMKPEEAESILDSFRGILDSAFEETKETAELLKDAEPASAPVPSAFTADFETKVQRDVLDRITQALVSWPDDFEVHRKLARLLERRPQSFADGKIEWAFAEALAFGSLLLDGHRVRLSGQDSGRGTFSQRHAILYDQTTGGHYIPLNHIPDSSGEDADQLPLQVYDSLLSEYAVLGFEYGYTVADDQALVCWEAQFGDFANGAQIMIDQFVASAEAKWGTQSSLVMLLPHGFEGQGPEHSSARLERFLQLCADENLIVGNFTTPANYFHALRRQIMLPEANGGIRKPMVLMTPKSLLRHPRAVSEASDLTDGRFHTVYPAANDDPQAASRLVFCSGKVYYDLLAAQEKMDNPASVGLIRVEQLYPFPEAEVRAELERFGHVTDVVWCQEEPQNMGAWSFVQPHLDGLLMERHGDCCVRPQYVGRPAAASPATGSSKVHAAEQDRLVSEALGQ